MQTSTPQDAIGVHIQQGSDNTPVAEHASVSQRQQVGDARKTSQQTQDASAPSPRPPMGHKERTEEYDTQRFDDEYPATSTHAMRFKQPDKEPEEYKKVQPCVETEPTDT
jgi:hypothetical protein